MKSVDNENFLSTRPPSNPPGPVCTGPSLSNDINLFLCVSSSVVIRYDVYGTDNIMQSALEVRLGYAQAMIDRGRGV
jgi:hypothetical protein